MAVFIHAVHGIHPSGARKPRACDAKPIRQIRAAKKERQAGYKARAKAKRQRKNSQRSAPISWQSYHWTVEDWQAEIAAVQY